MKETPALNERMDSGFRRNDGPLFKARGKLFAGMTGFRRNDGIRERNENIGDLKNLRRSFERSEVLHMKDGFLLSQE